MVASTLTSPEVWGMVASICTVLVFVLGGVWKISRLAALQLVATHENTNAIAELARRMNALEASARRTERAVS